MEHAHHAPRGKAFAVFRLSHVATYQPQTVDCRNCGGAEFSIAGGPCLACHGTGKNLVRRRLAPVSTIRVPGEWDELDQAEKVAKAIDWRLNPTIDLITRGAS